MTEIYNIKIICPQPIHSLFQPISFSRKYIQFKERKL